MKKMCNYIVNGKDVFVGLDVSKRTFAVNVRSEHMMVHQTSMPADNDVLLNYLKKNYPDCRIKLMYEAGFSGFGLHDYLTQAGITCIVTPPGSVTVEKVDKQKCDKSDATRLARNLENGDYKACEVPDKERREDRQISRVYEQVQDDIVRVKNRVRRFFDYFDLNEKNTSAAWHVSDWQKARKRSEDEDPIGLSLKMHFETLDSLMEHRRKLRKKLMELSRKPRYEKAVQILTSMPGVGVHSAIRMILEWGEDWSRFETAGEVASYSGLISSEYSTGDTPHRGHITGKSRGAVRGLLIQCAWTAIRYDPVLKDKYVRVRNNTGSMKKAIVAVARKMVVRMRAILLSGQMYEIGLVEEQQAKKVTDKK